MSNQERINGSGLFFFMSNLSEARQIEILDFYESLSILERQMINDLRHEASSETEFFNQS